MKVLPWSLIDFSLPELEELALCLLLCLLRDLRELYLQVHEVKDQTGLWLSCFLQTCTSLVSLNFAYLNGAVDMGALERLVARCPNLRNLKLNRSVPFDILQRILNLAPHLVDLGIGSYLDELKSETYEKFSNVVLNCKYVRSLLGFLEVAPACLPAMYSICSNLTFLNLSDAPGIYGPELRSIIIRCNKLQRLWILDYIGDDGLEVVIVMYKELQELRVFPSLVYDGVTEDELIGLSMNCPMLNSLLYYSQRMTNAALVTVAENCPNLVSFRLCILDPKKADYVTLDPLDEGFGVIIESCKGLRRLSLSGILADLAFTYVDMHGEQLETLSVAFAGDSDNGMLHVLNGCKKLKKLEIRDSQFGDMALLTNMGKYEAMRFLWMSSSEVTLEGCTRLANKMSKLNVEIMNENQEKLDDVRR
ncbi:hypothetical protein MKX01_000491 [Papaver californicum]|nr:hypothetical protein MKX01_000491 [Papaver californicum]